ncbi:hypothetical protein C3E77_04815 [Mycetocola zhujimingii]|nr:hypothetical protein C3E77_04815 [Mycetocola zhujimingii]
MLGDVTDADDDRDELDLWTPEAREQVRRTGEALLDAVREQLAALDAIGPESDLEELHRMGNRVDDAAVAFCDSQYALSGEYFSFAEVTESHDEDDEDVEDDDEDEGEPEEIPVISVLQRAEYNVVDSAAVLAAGREAYLRMWPSDSDEEARSRVDWLGAALYEIAHADGWQHLGKTPGLQPTGVITDVIAPTELIDLHADVEDGPDPAFSVQGNVLHRTVDQWGPPPKSIS